MIITLDDITTLQHNKLNTLSRKPIYLMIQGNAKIEGWATISRNDFSKPPHCLAAQLTPF